MFLGDLRESPTGPEVRQVGVDMQHGRSIPMCNSLCNSQLLRGSNFECRPTNRITGVGYREYHLGQTPDEGARLLRGESSLRATTTTTTEYIGNTDRKRDTMLTSISRRSFIAQRQAVRTIASSAVRRADPWPLPHSPEHIAATQTPKDEAKIPPIPRPNESEKSMRARLVYQSRKRGTLETDLLLSTFARDFLSTMSVAEMREYDKVRYI